MVKVCIGYTNADTTLKNMNMLVNAYLCTLHLSSERWGVLAKTCLGTIQLNT